MESLAELYGRHVGRVAQRWSSYLPILEGCLEPLRREPIRMLEIGIQNGGSLEIWAQYFARAEVIIGCDIDERCRTLQLEDSRVRLIVGDVTQSETQGAIAASSDQFDVIIDDGSHRSQDIIEAFVAMFPLLSEGGVYIIEDLHCSYYSSHGGGLFAQRSAMGFLRRLVDVVNGEHWGLHRDLIEHLQPLVEDSISEAFINSLPYIASLEFHNSVCIVRRDAGPRPRLGVRIVAGSFAEVDSEPFTVRGQPLIAEHQVESAANLDPIFHEARLQQLLDENARLVHREKELNQEIHELWRRLERILASPSYRLMNGPRRVFSAFFRG
jgi:hypothetical protein